MPSGRATSITLRVSAAFPNPRGVLRPGQYGRVSIATRTVADALLVPQRAVAEAQSGSQVRVVTAGDTVEIRTVQMGARVGSRWIVERGLSAGDRVIVDAGQLAEGVVVKTKPFVEAAAPTGTADTTAAPATPATPATPTGGR